MSAMTVNFNVANHGPVHIQDFVDYVGAGVEELGLRFQISFALRHDAINIMLDNFEDPTLTQEIQKTCRRNPQMPLIIVATEVMQDGVFNSGGWTAGIADASPYSNMDGWSRRTAGFRQIAPLAHTILCPSELLHESYVRHAVSDRLHYLPLVHFDRFVAYRPERAAGAEIEEDIDFLFTGVLTDRRRRLLEALDARGYVVRLLAVGAPEYLRHHYMRRAKVYLAPKHFDTTRTLSKMRAYWALCHGYYCLVEAGTDPTDLDRHLQWFTTVDELVAAAELDQATRAATVADQRAQFRAASSVNPFADPLAPWLRVAVASRS